MAADFGWSAADVSLTFTALHDDGRHRRIVAGKLQQYVKPRTLILLGGALIGIGMAFLGFVHSLAGGVRLRRPRRLRHGRRLPRRHHEQRHPLLPGPARHGLRHPRRRLRRGRRRLGSVRGVPHRPLRPGLGAPRHGDRLLLRRGGSLAAGVHGSRGLRPRGLVADVSPIAQPAVTARPRLEGHDAHAGLPRALAALRRRHPVGHDGDRPRLTHRPGRSSASLPRPPARS